MLRTRLLTGVVGVPIMVGCALMGNPILAFGLLIPVVIGTLEAHFMFRHLGRRPLSAASVFLSVSFLVDAAIPGHRFLQLACVLASIGSFAWLIRRETTEGAILDWAVTLAPPAYVGGALQFFIPLRDGEGGAFWVLSLLVCTWFTDIAAFFVGRAIGRTRLAPSVSPAKSVEGAVAGVILSIVIAIAAAPSLLAVAGLGPGAVLSAPSAVRMAGFGLVVGLCAVGGDLVESFFKRQCGVKDSSSLVPGHGGILDRFDSLIASLVGGYLYVVITS